MHTKSPLLWNDRDFVPANGVARRMAFTLALAASAVLQQAQAIAYVSGSISAEAPGPFTGTNINALVGATTFYDHGFTGTNAVIANIEEGHI